MRHKPSDEEKKRLQELENSFAEDFTSLLCKRCAYGKKYSPHHAAYAVNAFVHFIVLLLTNNYQE